MSPIPDVNIKMLPIAGILNIIQDEIFSGCKFLSKIGVAFFIMFIAAEFIKAAIEATSGRGFTLDKVLYLYLFLGILCAGYPLLQDVLKDLAYKGCQLIYKDFGGATLPFGTFFNCFKILVKSWLTNPAKLIFLPITVALLMLVLVFTLLISLLAMIAIDILIISAFLSFELVVASGLFFIPFFMSKDFSHIGRQWVNNILMVTIQLPILALVLKLVKALNDYSINYFAKYVLGKLYIWDMYAVLFIPLLGLGLIWQSLSLTKMLFPPSGGAVGTAIGMPIVGAVTYTGHTITRLAIGGR